MGCCGGGADPGKEARALENQRQADIAKGLTTIDATFAGRRGVNPITALTPGGTVYDATGSPVIVPQVMTAPKGPGYAWSQQAHQSWDAYQKQMADLQQQVAAGKLFGGVETSGGFDDAFYSKRKQDYLDFAMPQLAFQQKAAQKALSFSLARQGLLHSGASEQAGRDLSRQGGLGLQQIVDQAAGQENELRGNVEQERSRLINQLNATSNPNIAAQQAVSASANLRLPSTFAPIGSMFTDLTNQYVNKNLAGIWNNAGAGGGGAGYGFGYRSPVSAMPSSPSRVI